MLLRLVHGTAPGKPTTTNRSYHEAKQPTNSREEVAMSGLGTKLILDIPIDA